MLLLSCMGLCTQYIPIPKRSDVVIQYILGIVSRFIPSFRYGPVSSGYTIYSIDSETPPESQLLLSPNSMTHLFMTVDVSVSQIGPKIPNWQHENVYGPSLDPNIQNCSSNCYSKCSSRIFSWFCNRF